MRTLRLKELAGMTLVIALSITSLFQVEIAHANFEGTLVDGDQVTYGPDNSYVSWYITANTGDIINVSIEADETEENIYANLKSSNKGYGTIDQDIGNSIIDMWGRPDGTVVLPLNLSITAGETNLLSVVKAVGVTLSITVEIIERDPEEEFGTPDFELEHMHLNGSKITYKIFNNGQTPESYEGLYNTVYICGDSCTLLSKKVATDDESVTDQWASEFSGKSFGINLGSKYYQKLLTGMGVDESGIYKIRAYVDKGDALVELDEDNNDDFITVIFEQDSDGMWVPEQVSNSYSH